MRRHLAILVVLASAMALAGCGGSATNGTRGTSTLPTAPTTTVAASTVAPTTTLPPKATVGFPTSVDAANHLVDAWAAHDRASAGQGADAEAVAGIFATPDPSMDNRGCAIDDTLPEGACIFRTANGLVQVNTEKRPIGWVVVTAIYEPL